jgi:hypothetical protein
MRKSIHLIALTIMSVTLASVITVLVLNIYEAYYMGVNNITNSLELSEDYGFGMAVCLVSVLAFTLLMPISIFVSSSYLKRRKWFF